MLVRRCLQFPGLIVTKHKGAGIYLSKDSKLTLLNVGVFHFEMLSSQFTDQKINVHIDAEEIRVTVLDHFNCI